MASKSLTTPAGLPSLPQGDERSTLAAMERLDRVERLTNLVLVLLDTPRPLTLVEIAGEVAGYPNGVQAARQAFERDKRVLREEGIAITMETLPGEDGIGYRIRADDYYLPELRLRPDEQVALNLAVAGVHLDDASGQAALVKLGLTEGNQASAMATLPSLPQLAPLHRAMQGHCLVTFPYAGPRGTGTREVEPYGLLFRKGFWYLVGRDRQRGALRTFRVDRMEAEPSVGPPGTFEPPAEFDPSASLEEPWRLGGGPTLVAQVSIDPLLAHQVVAELGEEAVVDRAADGSVLIGLEVTNVEAFRSWALGLLDHAVVLGPPELRQAMITWLEEVATSGGGGGTASGGGRNGTCVDFVSYGDEINTSGGEVQRRREGGRAPAVPGQAAPTRRGSTTRPKPPVRKLDAAERLRCLLAILPWLASRGGAPIAEVAVRFGLPPDEVIALLELAACCGLPPYSPDQLIELIVSDDWVTANLGAHLSRPRRLSAAEGFTLAASARAILAVPGSDPSGALSRALAQLEAVLGQHLAVAIDLDEPSLLDPVRQALGAGRALEIEYYSASRDELTTRRVDPWSIFTEGGHWYLDGWCHLAGGVRHFRIDRIRAARAQAQPDVRPGQGGEPGGRPSHQGPVFAPGPGATLARLTVPSSARWVIETYPTEHVQEGSDGRLEVTLAVGGEAWLERLMLRLGPTAEVLEPNDLTQVGRRAATRLLARYRFTA